MQTKFCFLLLSHLLRGPYWKKTQQSLYHLHGFHFLINGKLVCLVSCRCFLPSISTPPPPPMWLTCSRKPMPRPSSWLMSSDRYRLLSCPPRSFTKQHLSSVLCWRSLVKIPVLFQQSGADSQAPDNHGPNRPLREPR